MSSKRNSLKYSYNKAYYEGTLTIVTGSADSSKSKRKKMMFILALQLIIACYLILFILTKDFTRSYEIAKQILEPIGYIGGVYFIIESLS